MVNRISYYIIATVVVCTIACNSAKYFRSNYNNINELLHETNNVTTKPFLKCHIKNGDVCIFRDSWKVDTTLNVISGNVVQYDYNRKQTFNGPIEIPISSIAIFETNSKLIKPESKRIAALSLLAGVDAMLGLFCVTNPKACFGSCPTFYIDENDNFHYADAEGFSNAILPSMEYGDVDALNNRYVSESTFSITMKNEALETHCINDIKLLVYPLSNGERAYHSSDNKYYLCENKYHVTHAKAEEGDITNALKYDDRIERFSLADENNLISREEIYLTFDNVSNNKDLGLIVNFRQTMMTTYLLYSAMGYMGDLVSDYYAMIENNKDAKGKFNKIKKLLGGIDIYTWNERTNEWEFQSQLYETGPIAFNKQFIPLRNTVSDSKIKIKIILNKGLWRIDYTSLTNIKKEITPIEISATSILNKGNIDNKALEELNANDKYLISMPGSEYKFHFKIPNSIQNYEMFLYSKGYYLEWMREHWIKDKDLIKLNQMVNNPEKYLKDEAKNYKLYENTIENEFWNSKIDTKTFSYHEN